jgi:nascent polypeptide-associated complex subunit alpha
MVLVEEVPAKEVEVSDESSSESGDEMPTLESAGHDEFGNKLNRAEKKARKAMLKLGMKPVEGVFRVTVKRSKSLLFAITKPDVYKSTNSETYVIFGEAKIDDFAAAAQASAAQQFTHAPEVAKVAASSSDSGAKAEEEIDESQIDETGLDSKDVDLIISQVGCSRGKAVNALRAANGDLVEAIMQLSS